MSTLDARAARAAAAVRESVDAAPPVADIRRVHRRHAAERVFTWSSAAAGSIALVVAVAWLRAPAPEPDVADPVPTTVAVTSTLDASPPTLPTVPESSVTTLPAAPTDGVKGPEEPATPPEPAADTTPPALEVLSPADGARLGEDVVRFEGTTEPGAKVRAGKWEADVGDGGSWSIVLVLSPGANGATFIATDEAGNETTAKITVYYEPPVTTTTTTEPAPSTTTTTKPAEPVYEFTAHQVYGECAEPLPYDVFYGTAHPGEKIRILSDYGSGTVYANAEGEWEIRVEFPEAPYGKEFVVRVKDEHEHVAEFLFVRLEA